MSLATRLEALPRRLCSAVCMSSSWRRRPSSASRSWVWASFRALSDGLTAWANCANRCASMRSLLANFPGGLGKVAGLARVDYHHREFRGSERGRHRHLQAPSGLQYDEYGSDVPKTLDEQRDTAPIVAHTQCSCSGQVATSSVSLDTSIPTNCSALLVFMALAPNLADTGSATQATVRGTQR
jgi:hypothetical protein